MDTLLRGKRAQGVRLELLLIQMIRLIQRTLSGRSWLLGLLAAFGLYGEEPAGLVSSFADYAALIADAHAASRPVRIEASVLYYDQSWRVLFLQDSTSGFYLNMPGEGFPIRPGQRVVLEGVAVPGEHGIELRSPAFTPLEEQGMPSPRQLGFAPLIGNRVPNGWVETTGTIQWLDDSAGVLPGSLTDGQMELGSCGTTTPRATCIDGSGRKPGCGERSR